MADRKSNGWAARSGRRSVLVIAGSTPAASDPVTQAILHLSDLGVDALRARWARRWRDPPPPIQSADILRRLLAWKIQAETYGDLDAETLESLKRAYAAVADGRSPIEIPRALRAGAILVREWRGAAHRVLVLDSGFEHDGKRYGSLSEVARAISGTRWSGPRFFGLEDSASKKVAKTGGAGPSR